MRFLLFGTIRASLACLCLDNLLVPNHTIALHTPLYPDILEREIEAYVKHGRGWVQVSCLNTNKPGYVGVDDSSTNRLGSAVVSTPFMK
jgi:hypothetical protein